jgi:hypothetical protein
VLEARPEQLKHTAQAQVGDSVRHPDRHMRWRVAGEARPSPVRYLPTPGSRLPPRTFSLPTANGKTKIKLSFASLH